MPGKFEAPRGGKPDPKRRRRKRKSNRLVILVPIAALLLVMVLVLTQCFGGKEEEPARPAATGESQVETTQPLETTEPEPTVEPVHVVATATIGTQGDLLMHKPIINVCRQEDGTYDFESVFRYTAEYTSKLDYAVANLETTFGGPNYPYQGNPEFNCPDDFLNSIVDAGYDMLLTANNHCSDTHTDGIKRTVEQVRGAELTALGTQLSDEEEKFAVVDVNGIKIGMICYTYADAATNDRPTLNFREQVKEVGLVNYFTVDNLNKFYTEVEGLMAQMEAAGAEATMLYIHWGTEYELTANATQQTIAQKICDLGIDVIVGGHPHVVQPMDLLESTVDPNHKTVCIYSLGNAVSNQRIAEMRLKTGHTEDGALFTVTFEKYSDGTVYVSGTDVLPTWVNYHANSGVTEYNIVPLDLERQDQWKELYNLTDAQFTSCQNSYTRTMDLVSAGLTECQTWLEQAKADRDQAYYDQAINPEAA